MQFPPLQGTEILMTMDGLRRRHENRKICVRAQQQLCCNNGEGTNPNHYIEQDALT